MGTTSAMRVIALALVVAALSAEPAAAAEPDSGASNDGTSVSVEAGDSTTGGGTGGAARPARPAGPKIDWQARYETLIGAMTREQVRETDRRSSEGREHRRLTAVRDDCAENQAYHAARAVRWVRVTERVAVQEPVTVYVQMPYYIEARMPVVVHERVPVVQRYTVRVRRGFSWVTQYHTRVVWVIRPVIRWRVERHLRWRVEARTVTRTVWKTVERLELQGHPAHTAAAAVYRACASNYSTAVASHRAVVERRRSGWDAQWSTLNRQAHEAWRHLNTRCQTVREVGDRDLQVCAYGEWRNFSPGSFERTIVVPPGPPPRPVIDQARDQITPPGPTIRMSPRVEWEQIVQFPTWMWIEPSAWQPLTARADAGRAWAEATAMPARVVWDMGNGDRVVCSGPGAVFDESAPDASQRTYCSYTYRQSSSGQPNDAYTVSATLVYDVNWQGSGGAGGNLGTVTRTTTAQVRVAELQALVTAAG